MVVVAVDVVLDCVVDVDVVVVLERVVVVNDGAPAASSSSPADPEPEPDASPRVPSVVPQSISTRRNGRSHILFEFICKIIVVMSMVA